jgi:predicted dehydrogenase
MPTVAVLGTNIGCTLHIRALRAAGFDVTALVGRDSEKTRARADHFGIPLALTSAQAAIDRDIDAVVVATPPETHHALVMSAIAAGKHILCEKPFSLDVGQAREMRDAAREADIANFVTHEFRWYAQNALARHAVQNGMIGEPIQMTALFDHNLCAQPALDVPRWWLRQDQGGGWLRNYNAHGIDLIRYMLGDFAAVCGTVHPGADKGMTSDDSYAAAFVLKSGVQGVMAGSCRAFDYFASSRITGSEGTMSIGMSDLTVVDGRGKSQIDVPPAIAESLRGGGPQVGAPAEALPQMEETTYVQTHSSDYGFAEMVGLCSAFASKIADRSYTNAAIADFDDGFAHVQVIDAVERSRRGGGWLELEGR